MSTQSPDFMDSHYQKFLRVATELGELEAEWRKETLQEVCDVSYSLGLSYLFLKRKVDKQCFPWFIW